MEEEEIGRIRVEEVDKKREEKGSFKAVWMEIE
jgi:hypothetical protein